MPMLSKATFKLLPSFMYGFFGITAMIAPFVFFEDTEIVPVALTFWKGSLTPVSTWWARAFGTGLFSIAMGPFIGMTSEAYFKQASSDAAAACPHQPAAAARLRSVDGASPLCARALADRALLHPEHRQLRADAPHDGEGRRRRVDVVVLRAGLRLLRRRQRSAVKVAALAGPRPATTGSAGCI